MANNKERRLGKGLAALLGSPMEEVVEPQGEAEPDALLHINVYDIDDNPFQPRREFSESEIASLSESLKEHQMLQPVLVRRVDGRYQLISGERRLRAAIQAGWDTVPARLREADDRLVAELAIVENLQRKDLNPIEKAMSFKRYLVQHQCTQEELAGRLKIDRSTIANLVRLLELPESILDDVRQGRVSAGHARALLPLGEERLQLEFAERIVRESWNVREAERRVQAQIRDEDEPAPALPLRGKAKNPQHALLEQEFKNALGARVELQANRRGKGKVTIHFANQDEFERIRALLTDPATRNAAA